MLWPAFFDLSLELANLVYNYSDLFFSLWLLNLVLSMHEIVTLAVAAVNNSIRQWLEIKPLSYFATGVDAGVRRWSGNEDRSGARYCKYDMRPGNNLSSIAE